MLSLSIGKINIPLKPPPVSLKRYLDKLVIPEKRNESQKINGENSLFCKEKEINIIKRNEKSKKGIIISLVFISIIISL